MCPVDGYAHDCSPRSISAGHACLAKAPTVAHNMPSSRLHDAIGHLITGTYRASTATALTTTGASVPVSNLNRPTRVIGLEHARRIVDIASGLGTAKLVGNCLQ